jgi:hypothetical protein
MSSPDQTPLRDGVVQATRLAVRACLAVLEPLAGRKAAEPEPAPAPELVRLDRAAESRVWRCETVDVLHAGAADAIQAAQDELRDTLTRIAPIMTLPQSAEAALPDPRAEAPPSAGKAAA